MHKRRKTRKMGGMFKSMLGFKIPGITRTKGSKTFINTESVNKLYEMHKDLKKLYNELATLYKLNLSLNESRIKSQLQIDIDIKEKEIDNFVGYSTIRQEEENKRLLEQEKKLKQEEENKRLLEQEEENERLLQDEKILKQEEENKRLLQQEEEINLKKQEKFYKQTESNQDNRIAQMTQNLKENKIAEMRQQSPNQISKIHQLSKDERQFMKEDAKSNIARYRDFMRKMGFIKSNNKN
jgi:hypothetical protein